MIKMYYLFLLRFNLHKRKIAGSISRLYAIILADAFIVTNINVKKIPSK